MTNPYAPPRAEPSAPPPASPLGERQMASREKRLAAAIVDAVVVFIAGTLLAFAYCELASVPKSLRIVRFGLMAASVPQWALLAMRGQTVGKIALKIQIVARDGATAGFVRAVALRVWPFTALALAAPLLVTTLRPLVQLVSLGDVLFIFRADRRCVHDWIAGTYVVDALPRARR